MGGALQAISSMRVKAKKDSKFRQELQDNPKKVLERELGRELSEEEVARALVELKKEGPDTGPRSS